MCRGVLVEALELQQGETDLALGVHGERERAHDRFGLQQRKTAEPLHLTVHPLDRLGFSLERGHIGHGRRRLRALGARLLRRANLHRAVADPAGVELPGLGRRGALAAHSLQDVREPAGILLALHAVQELDPLDARVCQTRAPLPARDFPQHLATVDHVALEK
jgi:hypothetical protein